MQRIFGIFWPTTLLFAVGGVLFFAEGVTLPYKVAYPVLLLGVSVCWLRRMDLLPVGAAFLLSAVGDAMGARGLFIPQMLFFALAHIAYICYFGPRAKLRPRVFSSVLLGTLFLMLLVFIVPGAADRIERAGVIVYGLVIAAMLYCVLHYRGAYAAGFRCAALLFVFSDSVIAWNRFVEPVPCRTWIVMTTYYLAQYLFYLFAVRSAGAHFPGHGRTSPPSAPSGSGGS